MNGGIILYADSYADSYLALHEEQVTQTAHAVRQGPWVVRLGERRGEGAWEGSGEGRGEGWSRAGGVRKNV